MAIVTVLGWTVLTRVVKHYAFLKAKDPGGYFAHIYTEGQSDFIGSVRLYRVSPTLLGQILTQSDIFRLNICQK